MVRDCDVCGRPFNAAPRQKRHEKCARRRASKNRVRTVNRTAHDLTFIGVDGEGVNRDDGTHDYVLLSVGDINYYRSDGERLHWREIFTFLYQQFQKYPHAVFVGYFLGYDFAQWVRTMPENRGRMLYDKKEIAKRKRTNSGGNRVPFPVYIDEWECDVLPGRRFRLRPSAPGNSWMYICDVGPFFQRSFITAINPKDWPFPIVSDDDYRLISEGKERRAVAQLDDAMKLYNIAENRALSRLMSVMNEGFVKADIRLNKDQWFGPGQAAQAWMSLIGCPTGEEIREAVPQWALDAARSAYYGGWFEIFCHGHIPGTSFENDEISSYPYTIASLPCLLHGQWEQGDGAGIPVQGTLRLVRAEVWGDDPHVGTMLHRTPRGTICRPHHTAGWYWWHELEAAYDAGLITTMRIEEWIHYTPCECPPPLGPIRELFEQRTQVGKNTPHGKALKLVYNSVYGKTAQSIGNPRYSNAIWASLITAGTRTRILNAIATHPTRTEDLLMVATDGVYFRTPHPNLTFSDNQLGMWEEQRKENLTLFMPGMYWDDKTRDRLKDGEAPVLKSRGVSAKALGGKISDIDGMFNDIHVTNTWPVADLDINVQIISPSQAIQRGDWTLAGHVIQNTLDNPLIRTISASPHTKRWPEPYVNDGIIRTVPYEHAPFGPLETTPYDGTFGETGEIMYTYEGEAVGIIAEMLSD